MDVCEVCRVQFDDQISHVVVVRYVGQMKEIGQLEPVHLGLGPIASQVFELNIWAVWVRAAGMLGPHWALVMSIPAVVGVDGSVRTHSVPFPQELCRGHEQRNPQAVELGQLVGHD